MNGAISMSRKQSFEIILPVHNGYAVLAECLASLERTLSPDDKLQIVDDASTDDRVVALLGEFAQRPFCGISVRRNAVNLGFVRTVNEAMARSASDVILLNSDTVATSGWTQRLVECLGSDPTIATATPFSNNAEICSFPVFCRSNPMPDDPEEIAACAERAGKPVYPDLPTGVGFCMAIRKEALEALGDFDAATFGMGYGEENDFCLRAKAHGWRNVLCDDAYVAHRGGASFSATGVKPGGDNLRRLSARYPSYGKIVADFIAADPLQPCRERIWALLSKRPSAGMAHGA